MNWKAKAHLQRLLSSLPRGERWNYLLQRFVTRSVPLDDRDFRFRAGLARDILELVRARLPGALGDATCFEFGAGTELVGPITFHAMGVERQIVTDRSELLRPALVLAALEQAERLGPELGFARLPRWDRSRSRREVLRSLRVKLGIDYRAPVDACATGLPPGSVEVVTSNSTLEHVPPEDLGPLLAECRRIIRPGGLICVRVDFEDHFAYADARLSPYNFLYYSDAAWARYNPSLHYQNRLRYRDYVQRFSGSGLELLEERRVEAGPDTLAQLDEARLDKRFQGYDRADLTMRKCTFLLGRGSALASGKDS